MRKEIFKNVLDLIEKKTADRAQPLVVAIGGGSGSGKTYYAASLQKYFDGRAEVLSADRYYRDTGRPNANTDTPDAFDIPLLFADLKIFRDGKSIRAPVYDYKTCTRTSETIPIASAPILIVEGVFMLLDEFVSVSDVKVFVQAKRETRLSRKLARDINRIGKSRAEILEYFGRVVHPMHERYVEPTRINADIIITNE